MPIARSLRSDAVDVGTLTLQMRRAMYALFERYYVASSFERFERDLTGKDTVFLINDEHGELCGFSTLAVFEMDVDGAPLRVVFSGDTIIEPSHWGSQAFAFSWIRHIGKIFGEAPCVPLFWLLIVKGHRTYRYLPAFGLNFVPNWRETGDTRLHKLKDAIARSLFGAAYDAPSGVVHFEHSLGHLATELAAITPREAARADVRFFLENNPGYVQGDELVCLCELKPENMRPLTRRLFYQGLSI
jgi:hypothetical protein